MKNEPLAGIRWVNVATSWCWEACAIGLSFFAKGRAGLFSWVGRWSGRKSPANSQKGRTPWHPETKLKTSSTPPLGDAKASSRRAHRQPNCPRRKRLQQQQHLNISQSHEHGRMSCHVSIKAVWQEPCCCYCKGVKADSCHNSWKGHHCERISPSWHRRLCHCQYGMRWLCSGACLLRDTVLLLGMHNVNRASTWLFCTHVSNIMHVCLK